MEKSKKVKEEKMRLIDILTEIAEERLKFHHSNAPDAKGKFKKLSAEKLANWLIRTRKGNMSKITGSLNQQANFNRKDDPAYARKMDRTREIVKRKLDKKKKK
jgi:hypothetical protein